MNGNRFATDGAAVAGMFLGQHTEIHCPYLIRDDDLDRFIAQAATVRQLARVMRVNMV